MRVEVLTEIVKRTLDPLPRNGEWSVLGSVNTNGYVADHVESILSLLPLLLIFERFILLYHTYKPQFELNFESHDRGDVVLAKYYIDGDKVRVVMAFGRRWGIRTVSDLTILVFKFLNVAGATLSVIAEHLKNVLSFIESLRTLSSLMNSGNESKEEQVTYSA